MRFFDDGVVAALFEFEGELFAARADDAAVYENVDVVGLDVVKQALVVGDDDGGEVAAAHGVNAVGNDFESVNVQAGVSLIEDGVFGFKHGHLEDFAAFFLTAGEAVVDGAGGEGAVHLEEVHLFVELFVESDGVEFFALGEAGLQGGADEVGDGDAGNFAGILEGEEEAGASSGVGFHFENVLPVECDAAFGDDVIFVARENFGQGAFARAVGAHDSVDLARGHCERQALENLFISNGGVKVFDF